MNCVVVIRLSLFMNGIFKEGNIFTFFYATFWSSWKTSNAAFNDEQLILRLMNFRKLRSISYIFPNDLIHNRWSDLHFKAVRQMIWSLSGYQISVKMFILCFIEYLGIEMNYPATRLKIMIIFLSTMIA